MAPKGHLTRCQKMADTKAATKILTASKDKKQIDVKRDALKKELTDLAKQKKAKERQLRSLKQKAQKIDLTELMQMLMMKAFLLSKDAAAAAASASGSSDPPAEPWVPKDGPEAVKKLAELTAMSTHPEVLEFAKTLRANYAASPPTEAATPDADPIEPSA
jgi:hypothetical protein